MLDFFLWLITFAVTAWLGIVLVLFAFQRSFLYHPADNPETPEALGVGEMRVVEFVTADGLKLFAWYAESAAAETPVLVLYHGNAGTLAMRAFKARAFLDAGFGVMLVEYRGFGGNPGRPTEQGLYEDGRAARRWLAAQGVPPERQILYGESLGTGVAVQMAIEEPPAAVVLEAPYTSITDVAAGIYPIVPVRLLTWDRYDSLSKIAGLKAPLLVVHGHRDRVVPFALGQRLFEAAPEPKRSVFLPQADHNSLYDWGAAEGILTFLRELGANGVSR